MARYIYCGDDPRKSGLAVSISDDAVIWLARMVRAEGGPGCDRHKASAYLWSIVNRYLLHLATPKWIRIAEEKGNIPHGGDALIAVIRMFSQPVNRRWARGGDLAIKAQSTPRLQRFATEKRLLARERHQTRSLSRISKEIVDAVIDMQAGLLEPPHELVYMAKYRISDWGSAAMMPKKMSRHESYGVRISDDVFFENRSLVKGDVLIRD